MPFPKIKLSDDSGNAVGVTDNRLNVNAYLSATPTIDIGDVSLLLGGTAADTGAGAYGAQTLRVTMAGDDILLTSMNTKLSNLADIEALLTTIDADTGSLISIINSSIHSNGSLQGGGASYGQAILGVRNDELAVIGGVGDNDYSVIQVNSIGGLYVTGSEVENAAVQSEPLLIGGRYDSSARTLGSGDAGAVALNASGHMLMDVVDGGQLDTIIDTLETTLTAIETDQAAIEALLITIDADTDAIKTAVQILDNAVHVDDAGFTLGTDSGVMMMGFAGTQLVDANDVAALACSSSGSLMVQLDPTGSTIVTEIEEEVAINDGGNSITVDGTVTANLGTTDNAVLDAMAASLVTIDSDTDAIKTAVEFLDDAIYVDDADWTATSSKHSLAGGVRSNAGVTDGDTTALRVGSQGELIVDVRNGGLLEGAVDGIETALANFGITGMQSDNNEGVDDTTAEVLKSSTACKRVDMQADPSNTGYIYVGGSDVSATKGIRLAPGDFYSIDIDNVADIFVLASVDEEDIHFTYYT